MFTPYFLSGTEWKLKVCVFSPRRDFSTCMAGAEGRKWAQFWEQE